MLVIGKIRLQSSNVVDLDKNIKGVPIVGFHGTGGEDYLVIDTAIREVEKYLRGSGESLDFSKITIVEDLIKSGYVKNDKPVKKTFNKRKVLVYTIDSNHLTK
jgi:hypothetical protein